MTTLITSPSSEFDARNLITGDRKPLRDYLNSTSLLWFIDRQNFRGDLKLVEKLASWTRQPPKRSKEISALATNWVAQVAEQTNEDLLGLECLAWAQSLPAIASPLTGEQFEELLDTLSTIAADAEGGSESLLARQRLGVELPLTLAVICSGAEARDEWLKGAKESFSEVLSEALTEDGTPTAAALPSIHGLLASWTRCLAIDKKFSTDLCDAATKLRLNTALLFAVRSQRFDGSAVFGPAASKSFVADDSANCFQVAVSLCGSEDVKAVVQAFSSAKSSGKRSKPKTRLAAAQQSAYSPTAQIAVLRTGWEADAAQLALAFEAERFSIELNSHNQTVFSGDWLPTITLNGKQQELNAAWEETCWFSDDEIDFLEVELWLGKGWRIQRQIVLAREDGLLLLADALTGTQSARIEYQSQIPFGPKTIFFPAAETREGACRWDAPPTNGVASNGSAAVYDSDPVVRGRAIPVFPLALPEWRSDAEPGELRTTGKAIELRQSTEGRGLYAPLVLDLNPARKRRQTTWRRLTVAEHLEIQRPEIAVGYRLQIDDEQWLFYRSMLSKGNRSLLGKNLFCDFLFSRFAADGTTHTLVEIE